MLIKGYIKDRKSKDRKFSYKVFAKELGLKSRGFIANLANEKRTASTATILALARVMKLNQDETRYFVNLACYSNAENKEVKKFYEKEIIKDIKKYVG
jgi:uncharacterized protein (TIGR02147 family)